MVKIEIISSLLIFLSLNSAQASNLNQFFSSGKTLKVQEYTTAGTFTWTKPTGVTAVSVECWGGGGGGGGGSCNVCNYSAVYGGGGGGSGFYAYKENIPVNGNVTVTIGAGGTGGSVITGSYANSQGGTGANSSFGTALVAKGGTGGNGNPGGSNITGVRMISTIGGTRGSTSFNQWGCTAGPSGGSGGTPYVSGAGNGGSGGSSLTSCCYGIYPDTGTYMYFPASAGGGGAGGKGNGGNGGNGHATSPTAGSAGDPGGAGGGGGGSCNGGTNGGAGGAGGIGYCSVSWWD